MKRIEKTFRLAKIGKITASVAVSGFLLTTSNLSAAVLDPNNFVEQNVLTTTSQTYQGLGEGIQAGAIEGDDNGVENVTNPVTMVLDNGAILSGGESVGGTFLSVFSIDKRDLADAVDPDPEGDFNNFTFGGSTQSTLVVNGNNIINGGVGYHLGFASQPAAITYTYSPPVVDALDLIEIRGDVNFNGNVNSTLIDILTGSADVQFDARVDRDAATGGLFTTLDYNGENASVTLGDGVVFDGVIINSSANDGDKTNGSLIFEGDGTVTGTIGNSTSGLALIQFDGSADNVTLSGSVTSNQLDYQATTAVTLTGSLLMTPDLVAGVVPGVTFNDKAGSLNIVGGNLTGIAGQVVVSSSTVNRGTLTFTGNSDGTNASTGQTVTGHIGKRVDDSDIAIAALNIGGTSTDNHANVTIDGNVIATTVKLWNDSNSIANLLDSHLTMSSGRNLTGTVTTDVNGMGDLTLAGGTQIVTGDVGSSSPGTNLWLNTVTSGAGNLPTVANATSTFTGKIYATNVNNSGSGTSNYQDNVTAINVGVLAGTSNFVQGLSATTTTISTGTGNFNTDDTSTTSSAIAFTGAGTANLHTGLTGSIDFNGNSAAVVNLWDGEDIDGNVVGDSSDGMLNALGAGSITGTVGSISELNVNRVTASAAGDTEGATTKKLAAADSIISTSAKLFNDGELELADDADLTTTMGLTTTTNNTGVLTLLGNGNIANVTTVTGNVGTAGTALRQVNAGSTLEADEFNDGVVYATTLAYSGNGSVQVNGLTSKTVAVVTNEVLTSGGSDLGFVGTVDFGTNSTNTGTFVLGDNVDLITHRATDALANTQTTFADANTATLTFVGSSVVTGQLGSGTVSNGAIATIGNDAFGTINAGVDGATVTFLNDVYVSTSTFHVTGTGVVNFVGDLNGPLVFDADGSVNVADGQVINGAVTTATDGTGVLNFVGGTTTQQQIGSDTGPLYLDQVNFHAATSDAVALPVTAADVTVNIGHNVYADFTTIGTNQNADADATTANVTANVFLGDALTLTAASTGPASNVTLNTAGGVTTANQAAVDAGTAVSLVDFAHTKNANGTLTNTAVVTRSTTGTGAITTNGATLNFAIGTTAWADPAGAIQGEGGTVNTATSSRVTGDTGSTLVMNDSETVNLSLLGSFRDGQSYTLFDVTNDSGNTSLPLILRDNSYVITTTLSRSSNDADADLDGDLLVTATRANNVYITASGTAGHFSNDAALRLGTLAAAGQDYDQDMQTVLNMLDIDQWGYGNNQANLAVQAQRLAPIANNSFGLSAFKTASLMNNSIGMRMHEMRIAEPGTDPEAVWIRSVYQHGEMDAITNASNVTYDGFETQITGVMLGLDTRPTEGSMVGLAAAYSNTEIDQTDFRDGDDATIDAWHASLYGAVDLTPELFLDATITGSWNETDGDRATVVGRNAEYDIDSDQISGKVNLGYRIPLGESGMTLTPLLSYEASRYNQDAYVETGAGDIGLSVDEQKLTWNQAAIGLRLAGTTMWGGMVAKPDLTVMATKESGDFAKPIVARYIGDNTAQASFTTQMLDESEYDDNGIKASLGLALLMSKTSSMNLRYEHNQNGDYQSNQLDLLVRWDF